jgi:hypothetical protein
MSVSTLEALRNAYPGRVYLTVEEVALVLRGKTTRKVKENVRKKVQDGSYGSGGRVVDGLWQLPITTVAEVLEPSPSPEPMPEARMPEPKATRRRAKIGPYLSFMRLSQFFASVYVALGEDEEALWLLKGMDAARNRHVEEQQQRRAQASKASLVDALGLAGVGEHRPKKRAF